MTRCLADEIILSDYLTVKKQTNKQNVTSHFRHVLPTLYSEEKKNTVDLNT